MRVLHMLAERGWSGGEVQLEHLLHGLGSHGHEQHVLLERGARFAQAAERLGVTVHEAPLRRPLAPALWQRVRRTVRQVRPDVVHFGCGRSLLWGGLASRGLAVAVRITTRRIDYPIGRAWHRGGRYCHLVDHVVANCDAVRRRVLDAGVPPQRVSVVHEGIDVAPWRDVRSRRDAARQRLCIASDALVVSCAATLRPRKGQAVLIAGFARLAARFPDALLVLAGSGSDRGRLQRLARRAGLEARVRLPGVVSPVAELYAASDLFCMPSFHEGLSNACLEASAAGLPLVVTDAGGLPEIVADGITGAVVRAGDAAALTEAMSLYLASADLRGAAGLAGRERTGRMFTAERMAQGMEHLFQRLLDDAHGRV